MLTRRQLPLNGLRSFEAAARHLNMGHAAAELGVTQGAISQQVRALEEQLGVVLFERTGNRLQLSSSGVRLLPVLRDSFNSIALEASNLDPERLEGELVVACTASALGNWLLKALPSFWSSYPNIKLHFDLIDREQEQIPADIDIAICYGHPKITHYEVKQLMHYELFPVCSPAYLNSLQTPLKKPKDLAKCTLLFDDDGEEWQRWMNATGTDITQINNRLYLSMSLLALQAARLGLGVWLADKLEVTDDLANGNLVRIYKDASYKAAHPYVIVAPPYAQLNARADAFITWLNSVFHDV